MRNLKRALSLGLTAAMISGLMVMGSSAASYADVTSENNVEAIEVLEAVGIMIGDESGNFNPDQNVTRNEMAVVMANLMEYNVASYKDTSPFTDVPSWAEPYVAACWTNGITAGYSDTIYGGSDTVTTAQAALMLMKALGYFQYSSDFGGDWQLATTRQGNAIDLFNGVDSGVTQAMTRNDVAQLVLNTLRSGTVEASTDGSWTIGDVTINNNVQYSYITSNQDYADAIDDVKSTSNTTDANRYVVELGEQLYQGDLKLNDNSDDDFMRPARTWSYDGKEIGTYAKRELLVESYTTGVTGRDMYDLLSSATIRDNELYNYVDGETGTIKDTDLVRANDEDLAGTGDGVLTKVYMDQEKDEITIVSIHSWLAKATADYNESKEYAPLTVYTGVNQTATYNVDVDEVASVADVAEDEFYQVNITYKDNTRGEVVAVSPVEVLADSTVTKYSASEKGDGAGRVTKLTTGGTEYKRNAMAYYDEDVLDTYDDGLLTDSTYNVYLDQYGYFLGVDLYDGAKNYVFITGYDRPTSNLSVKTADAAGIFLDGTMKKIEVNVKDTNENIKDAADSTYGTPSYFQLWTDNEGGQYALNRWYTYTVDADGVYTLKPAVRMTATNYDDDTTVNTSNLRVSDNVNGNTDALRGNVYGEDATVFVTVDLDEVDTTLDSDKTKRAITEVTGLYTGVQEVDLEIDHGTAIEEAEVYTVYDSDYFIIGAIVVGEGRGNNANIAYLIDGAKSEEYRDGMYYWEFECVMDGQVQTLTAKSKYLDTIRALRDDKDNDDGIVELRFDGDNYVVDVKDVDDIYGNNEYDKVTGTKPTYDISEYDVYDVTKGNELTLQGRSLYVLADRTDNGLALTNDAKAVVIQDENNKTDVKTEFSSVSAALSHLADRQPNKPGLQYSGRIIAALDNTGAATWVIFDSNTKLTTGSSSDSSSSGENFSFNSTIWPSGYAQGTLNVERPEYIDTGVALAFNYTIYVNGQPYFRDTDEIPAADRDVSVPWDNANSGFGWLMQPIEEGDRITASVDFTKTGAKSLDVQRYIIKVQDEHDNDITGKLSTPTNMWATKSGDVRNFQFKTGLYDAGGNFTLLDVENGTGTMTTTGTTPSTNMVATVKADCTGYVIVTLDTSALTVDDSVSVTYSAVNGKALSTMGVSDATDGGKNLVVSSSAASYANGSTFDITFKPSAAISNDATVLEYILYVTVNGTEYKVGALDKTAANTIDLTMRNVTSDVVVESARIETVNYLALDTASSSWDTATGTITLVFNQNVDASTVEDGITATLSNSYDIDTISVSGKKVTITVKNGDGSGLVAGTDTLTLDATDLKSVEKDSTGAQITVGSSDVTVHLNAGGAIA